jgi:hypothetical protein
MALVFVDRVKVATTSTGVGALTLGAPYFGFQDFSGVGDGNSTYYCVVDPNTGAWEVGSGTYTDAGSQLSRDSVSASSTGGSHIDFAAGVKEVMCVLSAEAATNAARVSVSDTPPTLPMSGQQWFDTASGIQYTRVGGQWVEPY